MQKECRAVLKGLPKIFDKYDVMSVKRREMAERTFRGQVELLEECYLENLNCKNN